MNTKLQELTDKIYAEGVEKGKNEAAEIVAAAKAEAQRIKEAAEAEARKIVEQANAKAAETTKNTQSELKLYTEQSLNALKTEITNLICDKVASDSVKAATADPKFMQAIIVAITKVWVKEGAVEIDAKDAKALEVKAGVAEGTVYDANGVSELSKVPTREVLLGRLLGSMQSPIANLARVLNQIAEKNGEAA